MRLPRYLERIGCQGSLRPDIASLKRLQKAHVFSVPFENLDVQLGIPVSMSVDAAYEKIVEKRRGGWCYEQNALFGWALSKIGFSVTRIAASVMREDRGSASDGTHLCLVVRAADSQTSYLVDVGFGGSTFIPIRLQSCEYDRTPYTVGLLRLGDRAWRFWEDMGEGRFSFDFSTEPADESLLKRKSDLQQSDPHSRFVKSLVVKRRLPDSHRVLQGRIYRDIERGSTRTRALDSAAELAVLLKQEFGLRVPDVDELWPKIVQRHAELFEVPPA